MLAKLLNEKIEETKRFLIEELAKYKKPVANVSFGKDSMVMLHLLREIQAFYPIVFYTSPWFPRKYDFARWVIATLDLEVYDYPPMRTSMLYGKGIAAFCDEFMTSQVTTVAVPKNIVEYQDGDDQSRFICGISFFTRPVGTLVYPWDVAIVGHKDTDSDQIYGDVPLHTRVLYRDAGPDYIYPLKEWTDTDIWDYTDYYQIPTQPDRYDRAKRQELADKTFNSDYFEACIRCVDARKAGQMVFCPKIQKEISNISDKVQTFDQKFEYFGVKEEK
jgi:3'-phosphoadenosine 5'-phosphosulfate sulfotransferase (PAPS reductase)/FAD synthetase